MRGSGVRILFAAPDPRRSRDVHSTSKNHCNLRHLTSSDVQDDDLTSTPEWGHQHSTDGRCPHVDGHRNTRLEAARRLLADTANTFEAVAREWLALQEKKLAPATFAKAVWTFETLVFPYIGSRPIAKLGSLRP